MRFLVPAAIPVLFWATIRVVGWRIDRHAAALHDAGGGDE